MFRNILSAQRWIFPCSLLILCSSSFLFWRLHVLDCLLESLDLMQYMPMRPGEDEIFGWPIWSLLAGCIAPESIIQQKEVLADVVLHMLEQARGRQV